MKRPILLSATLLLIMLLSALAANAQEAVTWTSSVSMTSQTEGVIKFTAKIAPGWHLYGFNMPEDGPVSTTVKMAKPKTLQWTDGLRYSPKAIKHVDDMFGVEVSYWEGTVTFSRKFKLEGATSAEVSVIVNYMACNDSNCQPPKDQVINIKIGK